MLGFWQFMYHVSVLHFVVGAVLDVGFWTLKFLSSFDPTTYWYISRIGWAVTYVKAVLDFRLVNRKG